MEASETIQEAAGGGSEQETERFRNRAALLIAILAMLLAITSLGGGNVAEDMFNSNIQASNYWAFYQAKNVRQTSNEIAAEQLETDLLLHGQGISPGVRRQIEERIAKYRATAERYESEPDPADPENPLKGEGKKQLMAQAKDWEQQRERATEQDPNFDLAEAFLQIAIVLGSVAILANSAPILTLAFGVGVFAAILMLNGFFLFFKLPF